VRAPAEPKIPEPTLLKLPLEVPTPANIPFVVSAMVEPPAIVLPVLNPEPKPPAEPKELIPVPVPPPKVAALPVIAPIPSAILPVKVPVVVVTTLRSPNPPPNPPVGPVEKGVTVVIVVGGVKLPPPFLLVPGVEKPGITVVKVSNPTGLTPAPKPALPLAVLFPPNPVAPIPMAAVVEPVMFPLAPPVELPVADPKAGVSMKPELPPTVLKLPPPLEPDVPVTALFSAVPDPLAVPPPKSAPETKKEPNCKLLAPLRPRLTLGFDAL